jgi:hypothetical protein
LLSSIDTSPTPENKFRGIYFLTPDALIAEIFKIILYISEQEAELAELKPRLRNTLSSNHEKNNIILNITRERDTYHIIITNLIVSGISINRTPEYPDRILFIDKDPKLLLIFFKKLKLRF